MKTVDLNCDLGESFGPYTMGQDEALLDYITSANIACGFHAGDAGTMHRTVRLALDRGVAVGAHPGLQDLIGFGRRRMDISPQEAYEIVVYQIGALWAFVRSEGGRLQHVKPHGELYNMAARDGALAEAVAEAVYRVDPELILYGLSGSELIAAGRRIGLKTACEVFADRTYQSDGSLTPRKQPDALIQQVEEAAAQVIRMVTEGKVMSRQLVDVEIEADTICVHGDGEQALAFVRTLRTKLEQVGLSVQANGRP